MLFKSMVAGLWLAYFKFIIVVILLASVAFEF